jgi:hypothetical protein
MWYSAQMIPRIDAEIVEKTHVCMDPNLIRSNDFYQPEIFAPVLPKKT